MFTMVWFSEHAWGKFERDVPMTQRALQAVDARGRSEVERYLDRELPVRVIEVNTRADPRVTAVRPMGVG